MNKGTPTIDRPIIQTVSSIQNPPLDVQGRCAYCGFSGEFVATKAAHYEQCEWANGDGDED